MTQHRKLSAAEEAELPPAVQAELRRLRRENARYRIERRQARLERDAALYRLSIATEETK